MNDSRKEANNLEFLRGWRPYFIILTLGFLLYSQTLFFNFTYLDDNALILDNYPIISNFQNVGAIFKNDVFFSPDKFYYRPILNLSFMSDAAIAGSLPVIFHLTNILLHILVAGLVFSLFSRWQPSRPLAFSFSLLFLVHPVLSQAVAWIPGRNDSLLAVFILASFLSFLNFTDQPRLRSYIAYLFFLFLALLTKETAIFFPLMIFFYFLVLEPRKVLVSDRWLIAAGSVLVGFFWFLMRHFALGGETTQANAALEQIIHNSPAFLVYLGKLLFPFNLSVFPILADSRLIYGLFALPLFILAWVFSRTKRNKYIIFSLFWFFLFLAPSFIRINGLPDFLEHRLYLSFIGFLLFLAEIDRIKDLDFKRKNVKIITAALLIFLALLAWRHSADFRNRLVFWQAAASSSPHSPLVEKNLGTMYYLDGNFSEAEIYYQNALALNAQEAMVHNNLGVIYLAQGDYRQAEQEFRNELSLNPRYDKALFNLGDLFYREKKYSEAAQFWLETLRVNPLYQEAYDRLTLLKKL